MRADFQEPGLSTRCSFQVSKMPGLRASGGFATNAGISRLGARGFCWSPKGRLRNGGSLKGEGELGELGTKRNISLQVG